MNHLLPWDRRGVSEFRPYSRRNITVCVVLSYFCIQNGFPGPVYKMQKLPDSRQKSVHKYSKGTLKIIWLSQWGLGRGRTTREGWGGDH